MKTRVNRNLSEWCLPKWIAHELAERTQCASPHFLFWTFFDRFVDSTPQNIAIFAVFRPYFTTLFEYLKFF